MDEGWGISHNIVKDVKLDSGVEYTVLKALLQYLAYVYLTFMIDIFVTIFCY